MEIQELRKSIRKTEREIFISNLEQLGEKVTSEFANRLLKVAVNSNRFDIFTAIIENRPESVSITDKFKENILTWAVRNGYNDVVDYVLRNKLADPNCMNSLKETPALIASKIGNLFALKLLAEYGADLEKRNKYGSTPLSKACYYGYLDIVMYLVEDKRVSLDKKSIPDGNTPLLNAVSNGYEKVALYLIEKGANIKNRNKKGDTVELMARKNELFELLRRMEKD